jgi:hypothetical protein
VGSRSNTSTSTPGSCLGGIGLDRVAPEVGGVNPLEALERFWQIVFVVDDGHHRCCTVGGENLIQDPRRRIAEPLPGANGFEQQTRTRHAHHLNVDSHPGQSIPCLDCFRHDPADGHNGHHRMGTWPQRVCTGDDLAAATFVGGRVGGNLCEFLPNGSGGQPEVGRSTVGAPNLEMELSRAHPTSMANTGS